MSQADLADVVDRAGETFEKAECREHRHRRDDERDRGRQQGDAAHGDRDPERWPNAKLASDPGGQEGTDQGPDAADGEDDAHRGGGELQLAVGKYQEDRTEDHVRAKVRRRGATGDPPQERVLEHHLEPLLHFGNEARRSARRARLRLWLGRFDRDQGKRGKEKRQCIDGHRLRAPDPLDQETGDGRPRHLGGGATDLELRVALEQVRTVHQHRQIGLVGDVEEHRKNAGTERDDVELFEGQHVEQVGDRDRSDGQHAAQVAGDHDRAAPKPIGVDAGDQAQRGKGQELEPRQHPNLEGTGMENQDRHGGDGEEGHLAAELADRLAGPEFEKVPVAPELTL